MPKVLGLDLSTHTGWAIMERPRDGVTNRPMFDTWLAPKEPSGFYSRRYAALFEFLEETREKHQFDAMGYESPWMNPGRDNMHMLRILTGFACVAETFAGIHKIVCREVSVQTVKKALTGNSYADKTLMKACAVRLNWDIKNDDEADAGSVAMCVIEELWPSHGILT